MQTSESVTLSAEDVRQLVESDWVDAGPDGRDVVRREALFTRCPKCQPDGLEFGGWSRTVIVLRSKLNVLAIPVPTAIALILQSIAGAGTAVRDGQWETTHNKLSVLYATLTTAIMSNDFPGAVAAMHRLKDFQDNS